MAVSLRVQTAFLGALILAVLAAAQGRGQSIGNGLVQRSTARQNGLDRAWFTQVQMDPRRDRVVDMTLNGGALFVVTKQSRLHVIDAETGRTIWAAQVGRIEHPTIGVDANDKYVAVVNGSMLYLVDRESGRYIWEKKLGGAPGSGPVMTKDKVLVPLVSGVLEAYTYVEDGRFPWKYETGGRTLVRPRVTNLSLSWPNKNGDLYIGSIDPLSIHSRLEALDEIVTTPAYDPPNLYAASLDGYVYCVNETKGTLQWKYSTGNPIVATPIAMEGRVYASSEQGAMFCLDGATGEPLWWSPGVARFLAASATRIYGLDDLNRMIILDKQTGSRLSTMNTQTLSLFMTNELTDRLYVGTDQGLLQCFHEIGQDTPLDYATKPIAAEEETTPASNAPLYLENSSAGASAESGAAPDQTTPADDASPAAQPGPQPASPPAETPPAAPPAAPPDADPFGAFDLSN